jgi:hypothetical protein
MNDAGTASFGTAAAVIGFARVAPDGDSRETHSVASHPTKYDEGIAIMKRSNRLVAIVATVALASVSSLALAQEAQVALGTAQTEEIDGWTGAVLATEGGQFARCSVESPDEDGTAMRLELAADGDLVLTLTADRWSLDTDSRVSLSFGSTAARRSRSRRRRPARSRCGSRSRSTFVSSSSCRSDGRCTF